MADVDDSASLDASAGGAGGGELATCLAFWAAFDFDLTPIADQGDGEDGTDDGTGKGAG